MNRMPGAAFGPSLIDRAAFAELLRQLGDSGAHRRFTHDFVSLWDTRARRLTIALVDGDAEAAEIVLLSISSSSAMIGASALESYALGIRACVRKGDVRNAMQRLPRLREIGRRSCAELIALVDRG